jgi:hypothetical protein
MVAGVAKTEPIGPATKKGGNVPSADGQGLKSLCMRKIAKQLNMLEASGAEINCSKSAKDCRFTHMRVCDITVSEARRRAAALNDKFLRDSMKVKIREMSKLFKK